MCVRECELCVCVCTCSPVMERPNNIGERARFADCVCCCTSAGVCGCAEAEAERGCGVRATERGAVRVSERFGAFGEFCCDFARTNDCLLLEAVCPSFCGFAVLGLFGFSLSLSSLSRCPNEENVAEPRAPALTSTPSWTAEVERPNVGLSLSPLSLSPFGEFMACAAVVICRTRERGLGGRLFGLLFEPEVARANMAGEPRGSVSVCLSLSFSLSFSDCLSLSACASAFALEFGTGEGSFSVSLSLSLSAAICLSLSVAVCSCGGCAMLLHRLIMASARCLYLATRR